MKWQKMWDTCNSAHCVQEVVELSDWRQKYGNQAGIKGGGYLAYRATCCAGGKGGMDSRRFLCYGGLLPKVANQDQLCFWGSLSEVSLAVHMACSC
jgi:hypothetical protein